MKVMKRRGNFDILLASGEITRSTLYRSMCAVHVKQSKCIFGTKV